MLGTGRSGFQRANARGSDSEVGDVYFVACNNEFVKIGFARDVTIRLAELQTGCPYELKVIGLLKTVRMITEQWFHVVLRDERVRGEWFRLSAGVRLVIQQINDGAYPFDAADVARLYGSVPGRERVAVIREQRYIPPAP